MGAGRFSCLTIRYFAFVHVAIGYAFFNRKIGASRRIYCLNNYKINSSHFSRHGLTHPAAQWQQGYHEYEYEATHVLMMA